MPRVTGYVVIVLVLTMLGIAMRQKVIGDAKSTIQNQAGSSVSLSVPAHRDTELAAIVSHTTQSLQPTSDAISIQTSSPVTGSTSESSSTSTGYLAVTVQQDHDRESQPATPINTEADSKEIIGRPFPMSASVESQCNDEAKSPPSCHQALQLLAQMSQEPRDPAWAADTETKLRALIMADPNQFTIRAIECRTSLCAVEVASIFGQYFGHLDGDVSLDKSLWRGIWIFGYERDASSDRVTITVQTFKRR